MKKIIILYGGRSSEHEVSLVSAASIVRHLRHRDLKRWFRDDQARRQSDDTDLDRHDRAPPGRRGNTPSPGTARTTTASRSGLALTRSASRLRRAWDLPADPEGSRHRRQTVRRGLEGQRRDQVGLDRLSSKRRRPLASSRGVPQSTRGCLAGGSPAAHTAVARRVRNRER